MSKRKHAWTWDDYYRQLAIDERREKRAAERRRKDQQVSRRGYSDSDKGAASAKEDRCEGVAPEGASGSAAARKDMPANATQARPSFKLEAEEAPAPRAGGKIDLSTAPSGMELTAEEWRSPASKADKMLDVYRREAEAGRAYCLCGGKGIEGGFVPVWFGRDCIEKECVLRVAKASRTKGVGRKNA